MPSKSALVQCIANDLFKVRGYHHLWCTDEKVYGLLETSEGWGGEPSKRLRFSITPATEYQREPVNGTNVLICKHMAVRIEGSSAVEAADIGDFTAFGGEIRYWVNSKIATDKGVPAQDLATAVERAVLALEWLSPVR